LLLFCVFYKSKATQLSGSYTINPVLTATTTNFKDFQSAVNFLTGTTARPDGGPANTLPVGVNGPVTFVVSAGSYTGQVIVPIVPGTSPINTVTFDGINATVCTLTVSIATQAAFVINQAKYVVVKNLTVNNNALNTPFGIAIVGTNTSNEGTGCRISKCVVNLPNTNISNTSAGIVVTATALGGGNSNNRIDSVLIDSNTVNGGYYGISFYGNTGALTTVNRANSLVGNTVNSYYMGLYIYYHYNRFDVINNTVNIYPTTSLSYGIYHYYCRNSTTQGSIIAGNKVYNASYMGMYVASSNDGTSNSTQIYNNVIAGNFGYSTNYGMYTVTTHRLNVWHNSVDIGLGSAGSTKYAYYYTGATTGSVFKNNQFTISAITGTTTYPAYFSTNPTGNVINYNNYFNAAGANIVYRGAAQTVATYKQATTGGDSSSNVRLDYTSITNLQLLSGCNPTGVNNNLAMPSDINGITRGLTPFVGAYEVTVLNNDLAIDAYLYPVPPITVGSQDLAFRVKNLGATPITSFTANYSLNGGTPISVTWNGTLNQCDTATVLFNAGNQITLGAINQIKVYVSSPNSLSDPNRNNDTLSRTYYVPLNGTYTVGGTSSNFTDLATAASIISSAGVNGPVVFNINPGTYNGKVEFNGPISGVNATNTITIDGGNALGTILTANTNGAPVLLVNQVGYTTIKNITVTQQSSAGAGISIAGNNTNTIGSVCTIKNCLVNLPNSNYSTTSYGILTTGNANGFGTSNNKLDSILVDSNVVNGGYMGLAIYGNTGGSSANNRFIKITNNIVNNAYYYGAYIYYIYNQIDFVNNVITMVPGNSINYGVYHYYCQNQSAIPSRFNNNKIYNASYMGAYIAASNNATGNATQVYNNMIGGQFLYSTNYGLYTTTTHQLDVLHNTVNIGEGSMGSTMYSFYYSGAAAGSRFMNNQFSITALSGSTAYPAYFSTNPTGSVVDFNNYYNKAGTNLLYRGVAINSTGYKTATTGGDSSYNQLARYQSESDLHYVDGCTPLGTNLNAFVPNDIDGNLHSSSPRVGAHDFSGLLNEVSIERLVAPSAPVTAGLQDVVVRVKNNGSNTITSLNVSYRNNTGTLFTQNWTGTLSSCDTTSIVFTGANQINIGALNNLIVFIDSPNNNIDPKRENDTVRATFVAPLAGNYTIGGTGASYPDFISAAAALTTAGVSAPVTFTVNPGTYFGQVIIEGPISGSSSTNTITFNGVNATNRIIQDTLGRAALIIRNQSNVVFLNLTVTNTFSGTATGIAIVGNTSNNNGSNITIKNCVVNLPNVATATSYGINVTGSIAGMGDGAHNMDSIWLDSNTVNGGYYGININRGTTGSNTNNYGYKVTGNTVNAYYMGVRLYYIFNAIDFRNNTVIMPTSTTSINYGVYHYYCTNSGTTPHTIINNRVWNASYMGMYIASSNNGTSNATQIVNNLIGGVFGYSTNYGLYAPTTHMLNVVHNTVDIGVGSQGGTKYAFYYTGAVTGSNFKNNIFSITANSGTTTYPAYFGTNPTGNVINYNNYYNAAGTNIIYRGAAYTNANYLGAAIGGDTSYNQNPSFFGLTDLRTNNACTKGFDFNALYPIDAFGNVRLTPPVVGAHESTGTLNEISIDKVYLASPITAGLQDFAVRVRNNGSNAVTSFNLTYQVNNGQPVSQSFNGALNSCGDTAYLVFTGAQQLNLIAGSNLLKVYTSLPNNVPDNNRSNDTTLNALTTITLVPGNALVCNGTGGVTAGSSLRFTSRPEMIGTNAFTAEVWVKVPSTSGDQKVVSKSSVTDGFVLGISNGKFDPEIWTVANGTSSVRITTAGTSLVNNVIPTNEWTHLAVTWQSGVGVKAYINGQLVGFLNSTTVTTMKQSITDMFIGTNSWDYGFPLTGRVDELRLWNVALDSLQLRKNMHRTLKGTETGLTTYIQFNEATNATLFADVVGGASGIRNAAALIAPSGVPVGGDSVAVYSGVNTTGVWNEGDLSLNITDAFDNGCDLLLKELPLAPNFQPATTNTYPLKYWIIRPIGVPGVFAADITLNMPAGSLNTNDVALGLYRRGFGVDTNTWYFAKAAASITTTSVTFSGIDTLGQFALGSNGNSSLPVTLLSFGAQKVAGGISIDWTSVNEINALKYEIERSYDGVNFETIGAVAAKGNYKGSLKYRYYDYKFDLNNTVFYRLKQIDFDGKYMYSPIAVIEGEAQTANIQVYPNPFTSKVFFELPLTIDGNVRIQVKDLNGVLVSTYEVNLQHQNTVELTLNKEMKAGAYIAEVLTNEKIYRVKLIKD